MGHSKRVHGLKRSLNEQSVACGIVKLQSHFDPLIMQEVIRPLLDTVQDIRVLGLKLKDDAICTEFGLVGKIDSIAVIVVVVEE